MLSSLSSDIADGGKMEAQSQQQNKTNPEDAGAVNIYLYNVCGSRLIMSLANCKCDPR